MDGRISLEELKVFAKKTGLVNFTTDLIRKMFYEITKKRGIAHKHQLDAPILPEELYLCCNLKLNLVIAKHTWDTKTKSWGIKCRPYYEQWVELLRMVDPYIYAPCPSILVPKRILAQYEKPVPNKPISYTNRYGKTALMISDISETVVEQVEIPEVFI